MKEQTITISIITPYHDFSTYYAYLSYQQWQTKISVFTSFFCRSHKSFLSDDKSFLSTSQIASIFLSIFFLISQQIWQNFLESSSFQQSLKTSKVTQKKTNMVPDPPPLSACITFLTLTQVKTLSKLEGYGGGIQFDICSCKRMADVYNHLSKEELVNLVLALNEDKKQLDQQVTLKDKLIHELTRRHSNSSSKAQTKPNVQNSFFDKEFSKGYFKIEEQTSVATKLKRGDWPSLRSKDVITGTKSFKLKMPGYGLIGLGTQNMKKDGCPAYTTEGWMICTDGRVYHNNENTANNDLINFENKTVTVKVDVPNAEITIDGVTQKLGDNCPKEAYFVISYHSKGTIKLIPLPQ